MVQDNLPMLFPQNTSGITDYQQKDMADGVTMATGSGYWGMSGIADNTSQLR